MAELSIEDQEVLDEIRADYLAALDERIQGRTKSGSENDLFGAH